MLAGLFFSMATLTRTPLVFAGLFFVLEALCPGPDRLEQLRPSAANWKPAARKLGLFGLGAAPLALLAAAYNLYRFGKLSEFGHAFLYNNRVNADIDRYGLFDFAYLQRNLEAAFLKLPAGVPEPAPAGLRPARPDAAADAAAARLPGHPEDAPAAALAAVAHRGGVRAAGALLPEHRLHAVRLPLQPGLHALPAAALRHRRLVASEPAVQWPWWRSACW